MVIGFQLSVIGYKRKPFLNEGEIRRKGNPQQYAERETPYQKPLSNTPSNTQKGKRPIKNPYQKHPYQKPLLTDD